MTKAGKNRFLLVYGSQTGQAQAISEEIAENVTNYGLVADLHSLEQTEKRFWLERETCAVIVTSTTGDGEVPDNAQKFWRRLKKRTLPKDHMKNLHFTLLGLGDSNYTNFCNCGKAFNKRLLQLGAQHFYEPGWADDATGLEVVAEPWMEGLYSALQKHLGIDPAEFPVSDLPTLNGHVDSEPNKDINNMTSASENNIDFAVSYKTVVKTSQTTQFSEDKHKMDDSSNVHTQNTPVSRTVPALNSLKESSARENISDKVDATAVSVEQKVDFKQCAAETSDTQTGDKVNSLTCSWPPLHENGLSLPVLPAAYLKITYLPQESVDLDSLPIQNGCVMPSSGSDVSMATVTRVTCMTSDDAVKKALKFELDISSCGWTYRPGDAVGIVCPNSPAEVNDLLFRLNLQDFADTVYELSIIEGTKKRNPSVPKHVPNRATLRHILTTCLDIRSTPKKAFLRSLVEYTEDAGEKTRFQELCSKQGANHYSQYVRDAGLSLMDILKAFPSCFPPACTLIEQLPRLQPRPYSAASSLYAHPGRLHFVFNVVHIPATQGRLSTREGVCTGWLNRLTENVQHKVGEDVTEKLNTLSVSDIKLPVFLRSNNLFRPLEDLSRPVIMVGPGTGVAPFLGFLQEREARLASMEEKSQAGEIWLFYGCRHQDKDNLFRDELQQFNKKGILTHLKVTFSRDVQPEGSPRYVQDMLKLHGKEIFQLLDQKDARVYVCGDAKGMAKGVLEAFTEIVKNHGGLDDKGASDYVMRLRIFKQYLEDVWS